MDAFCKGWFTDKCDDIWPGQALSLEVEQILHHEKSEYQDILIFQSKQYGRVLALDQIIQSTERDEFAYQEMIAHLPLCSHPNPKNVLVVGGGTGGVAREVAKHSCVEEIHLCELDKRVIELSKQYLPHLSCGFSDPRVQIHIQEGDTFVKGCKQKFDVIISDVSDDIDNGPSEDFFEETYIMAIKEALAPGGIHCVGADSIWVSLKDNAELVECHRKMFPAVSYACAIIPSYPGGGIGFSLSSLEPGTVFEQPLRRLSEDQVKKMGLRYYNSDVHEAAFILPQFAKKAIHPVK